MASVQRAAKRPKRTLARPSARSAIPHLTPPPPTLADTLPIWCVAAFRRDTEKWSVVTPGLTEAEAYSRASDANTRFGKQFPGAAMHVTFHRERTKVVLARGAGTWEGDEVQPGEQSA